jgi:2-polyprenyl-3-methyl-5-hydroxy-6-metoxy-1,4-benzoquinol methylase
MDIKEVLHTKFESLNGVFINKGQSKINYPEKGNDFYFELEDESYWFVHRNEIILSLIEKFFEKKEFLDVGGGNGFNSFSVQNVIEDVYLLEPGLNGCLNAKDRGVKNIICSTLESLNIENVKVDAVGLFDVLEHIEDDDYFLLQIHQILKDNGLIILSVPAYNMLWSNEDKIAGHFRRYKKQELEILLKKTGFEILFSTYFFSILFLPIFFLRSIPSLLLKKSQSLKETKNQHQLPDNLIGKLINYFLKKELKGFYNLSTKKIGSSLIIVARKK